ncbi:hypothetical protein Taro_046091 [Colocasia esculenta]|uniref:Myb/SANT-like domain-containing protein n=1 Tax=Colocasia esculenta TaxID=4460 RepID=A0A843WSW5_COLES|nr:hypothetical protein [Colocasia esculenta]
MHPSAKRRKEEDERCTNASTSNPDQSTASSSSSNSVYLRRQKKSRIDEGMSDGVPVEDGKKVRRPNWETSMDRVLLDLMIEEMHKKNYTCGSFKVASWRSIGHLFNVAMGENSTWVQVKERFKNLKRRYALYEELLKLSGWGWDPETQCPIPGYEGAWDEALRVNSRFSTIKRKPFPLYDQMQLLCKNSTCTGE